MTIPTIGDDVARLDWRLVPGQADSRRLAFTPSLPDGTWTAVALSARTDVDLDATVTTDGDTLVVEWTGEQTAAIVGRSWRLRLDGLDIAGGLTRRASPEQTAGQDVTITVAAADTDATITVAGFTGPVSSDDVIVPANTLANVPVDAPATAILSGLGGAVGGLYQAIEAPAARTITLLSTRARLIDPPTKWLRCVGGMGGNYWSTPTTLASPTDTMRVRALARTRIAADTSSVDDFQEIYSESADGLVGALDRFELAFAVDDVGQVWLFWEHLEVGATLETSYADDAGPIYLSGRGAQLPGSTWVEVEVEVDFAAGTIAYRLRTDIGWNHTDPDDDTLWRENRVYEIGAPTTLEASDGMEQWIGRNPGTFDVARVRRWDDGVLVLDADPSGATVGDTSFPDAVLESAPGTPAVWTAVGVNTIANTP